MKVGISVLGLRDQVREIKTKFEENLSDLARVTEQEARRATPVLSGNARRNWNTEIRRDGFVVENRVPYIERLEAGASKQAPRGITTPAVAAVKRRISR